MPHRILTSFMGLLVCMIASALPTYYDTKKGSVHQLFKKGQGKYVLRYTHKFSDTLYIPHGCEVRFKGGRLTGPVVFNATKLSGNVSLKGSHIKGSVRNDTFNASWLCAKDGVTDDAPSINEIITVCGNVFFPRGTYRLVSAYKHEKFHIGIIKDNVSLKGERGTVFLTKEQLGIVCVFSKPYDIPNSVRNISLEGLTFRTVNDGSVFLEWTHAIQTKGVNGFTIENCTIEDFWGDGICLNHYNDNPQTGERARNQNVRIENNTIVGGELHNNRNGISVINGQNVLIQGNTIRNTSSNKMPGAIDVEPNNSAYTIENIKIIGNTIEGSRGRCGAIEICMVKGGPGYNISVEKNYISNSNRGIYICLKTEDTTDHFVIRNNHIAADTPPYKFVGSGKSKNWVISGNRFERRTDERIPGDLQIENLQVR
ncbi:MAG: right-handed parallel beta-helix repeat-containing protein [Prevotella sp.]|nr:right-handed parallel beta-helix repeat-containing protein [Prevotella sp.]